MKYGFGNLDSWTKYVCSWVAICSQRCPSGRDRWAYVSMGLDCGNHIRVHSYSNISQGILFTWSIVRTCFWTLNWNLLYETRTGALPCHCGFAICIHCDWPCSTGRITRFIRTYDADYPWTISVVWQPNILISSEIQLHISQLYVCLRPLSESDAMMNRLEAIIYVWNATLYLSLAASQRSYQRLLR